MKLTPYNVSYLPLRGRLWFAYGYWKQRAILALPRPLYRVFAYFYRRNK